VTTEKQQKAYGVLIIFIVILFLGAQFGLRYILQQSSTELESASKNLAKESSTRDSRSSLSKRYEAFEKSTAGSSSERQFPANGNDLFTAITNILKEYSIEFTSGGSTGTPIKGAAGASGGTQFKLTISFSGQYYNVVKALAAIRESGYIMKLLSLNINAEGNNVVKGSMVIESRARAQI
jgi:hypothetical protein